MSHPKDRLPDLLLGNLSPEEARAVEAHLEHCEACRTDLRAFNETLVGVVESLSPATPPTTAWAGIQTRVGAEESERTPPPPRRMGYPLTLAATLLLALAGVFWAFQERQSVEMLANEQRKVAGWLSRPDVVTQQITDPDGERLGSLLTLSDGRALFVLRDAPPAGSTYRVWGYRDETPVALGTSGRTLLEFPYGEYEIVELSLESENSLRPTRSLSRVNVSEGAP